MGKSGANATTEEHLLEWYNKVCAQKYLHLIYCTPRSDYDRYGLIVLEILDVDKEHYTTKIKVHYNNPNDGQQYFLGYLTINVKDIINKEWYKTYRERKMFAMDLLLKESIKDVRELEFALITLMGYKQCRQLAELGVKDRDIVRTKLDTLIREAKAVYSLVSKEEVVARVTAILTPVLMIKHARNELHKNRVKPLTPQQTDELKQQIQIFQKELLLMYQEQEKLIQMYLKYTEIGNKGQNEEIKRICKKYKLMEEPT